MKAAITIFALAIFARADTVELKTGERIDGQFKQATAAGVVIEVAGQPITLQLDQVQAIYFGSSSRPSTAQQPAASAESLEVLKALTSVTNSGVGLQEYSRRVLDAKVTVDKYLASPKSDDATRRAAIDAAMRYYEMASQAWNANARTNADSLSIHLRIGRALREDPALKDCPDVVKTVAAADGYRSPLRRSPPQTEDERNALIGALIGGRPSALWSCAASKIAEAEKH